MFNKISLTLVVYLVAIFAISTLVEAKSFDSVNRRDHENLKRLIKKRVAIEVPEGVGSDADSVTASAAGASSATAGSSSSSATSTPTTSATSASSSSNSASSSSSVSTELRIGGQSFKHFVSSPLSPLTAVHQAAALPLLLLAPRVLPLPPPPAAALLYLHCPRLPLPLLVLLPQLLRRLLKRLPPLLILKQLLCLAQKLHLPELRQRLVRQPQVSLKTSRLHPVASP